MEVRIIFNRPFTVKLQGFIGKKLEHFMLFKTWSLLFNVVGAGKEIVRDVLYLHSRSYLGTEFKRQYCILKVRVPIILRRTARPNPSNLYCRISLSAPHPGKTRNKIHKIEIPVHI